MRGSYKYNAKVWRKMGISNGRRKIKSVVAVLQMINLYQRQLKLAQLNHPRIVPWSKAISPSSDIELADKTLLIKGRSTDNGLLERLNMCSDVENEAMTAEVVDKFSEPSDHTELPASSSRTRSCTKNVRYDVSIFDSNDDDSDGDLEVIQPEGKHKKSDEAGWLARKISSGFHKLSKLGKKSQVSHTPDTSKRASAREPTENDDGMDSEVIEAKPQSSKDRANKQKTDEADSNKDGRLSMKRKILKVAAKKSKPKLELLPEFDQEEAGDNEGKIAEENNEEPRAPQRKRKKVEDPLFSCPMCDRKFVESEINQHAFTCNAEPLYESRSRTNGLDKAEEFIPLGSRTKFYQDAESRDCRPTLSAIDKSYSKWKNSCEKISTGTNRNTGKYEKGILEIDLTSSLRRLPEDSACANEISTSSNGNQKKDRDHGQARKPVKPTLCSNSSSCKSKASILGDSSNWMSDDSSNDNSNLTDQYLDVGKEKNRKRTTRENKPRPNFIEEDSDNEKCYICSRDMCGIPKSEYEAHVNKCIEKASAKYDLDRNENSCGKV